MFSLPSVTSQMWGMGRADRWYWPRKAIFIPSPRPLWPSITEVSPSNTPQEKPADGNTRQYNFYDPIWRNYACIYLLTPKAHFLKCIVKRHWQKYEMRASLVERLIPCPCRRHGFDPWPVKIPHAEELLSLCLRAWEPQRLSPNTLELVPHLEKPL